MLFIACRSTRRAKARKAGANRKTIGRIGACTVVLPSIRFEVRTYRFGFVRTDLGPVMDVFRFRRTFWDGEGTISAGGTIGLGALDKRYGVWALGAGELLLFSLLSSSFSSAFAFLAVHTFDRVPPFVARER